jgi:hypothetical protein
MCAAGVFRATATDHADYRARLIEFYLPYSQGRGQKGVTRVDSNRRQDPEPELMSSGIPETMFGVVLTGHGGLDKLQWRDDLPVPRPGPNEVLVRVHASPVNNTDINTRTAWYSKSIGGDTASAAARKDIPADIPDGGWSGKPIAFPRIQGADCCGEILGVGAEIPTSRIGERVLVRTLYLRDLTLYGSTFHPDNIFEDLVGYIIGQT